jgi:hypothetical protein
MTALSVVDAHKQQRTLFTASEAELRN